METSDIVYFGDPKIILLFFLSRAILFVGIAAAFHWLVSTDNAMRRELQGLFGERKFRLTFRRGIVWIWMPCIVVLGWYYQATLGSRFFAVQWEMHGETPNWKFVYHYPRRERLIEDQAITGWDSRIDWSQRAPKNSLIVSLDDGSHLRSVADNMLSHEESLKKRALLEANHKPKPQPLPPGLEQDGDGQNLIP